MTQTQLQIEPRVEPSSNYPGGIPALMARLRQMKQFASLFTHGVRNGSELRHAVHHSDTGAEILDKVDAFFTATSASAD